MTKEVEMKTGFEIVAGLLTAGFLIAFSSEPESGPFRAGDEVWYDNQFCDQPREYLVLGTDGDSLVILQSNENPNATLLVNRSQVYLR